MPDNERPTLGVGDYIKGHCFAHDHHVEGRVLDDDGEQRIRVRFEDALGVASIHLVRRNECVLVERAVPPTPPGKALCHICGERARYRVVETGALGWLFTPVCKVHRRAAKNMGHLTCHEDMVSTFGATP